MKQPAKAFWERGVCLKVGEVGWDSNTCRRNGTAFLLKGKS